MVEDERKPQLVFWFDFASTYSYLSAMRIEDLARDAGVEITWMPFLLGPIFQSQGWDTSPFDIYPAKGRYMWRDMERLAASRGLPFTKPPTFPARSLAAARLAHAWDNDKSLPAFCRAVFHAGFGQGQDISDTGLLDQLTVEAGGDPDAIRRNLADPEIKKRLRAATDQARDLGLFGAPSFTTSDNELFWGDDRLEMAIEQTVATT